MIEIHKATTGDIPAIQQVARQTWPDTFKDILTEEQIAYMLNMMYSTASLAEQMEQKGHLFFLAQEEGRCLGFVSCETGYNNSAKTKIHKIYILPETQGRGVGKKLIRKSAEVAREKGDVILSLNVNKYNPAIGFYERIGFKKTAEEVISIGNGYVMDDFVMDWSFEGGSEI
ncbi:GNAT family N-acetyltransferase [Sinomicrobium weinanense]|uniref:GNAT family N-acetyltransferase n=1 Tax=Sinomicrobium weinanense TaxID=2842200 RepID=A0A926JSD2_9FLAO|nr:GNAT family N-acetyltransferase [Sinomicrobium weinanense]MBC9796383.1 GNAT family N-acetyltransferase [Sinomicrobium weinanense]MBU3122616.1 GNAT family N-acetyltransferase [Sinomicrobium weinanense]